MLLSGQDKEVRDNFSSSRDSLDSRSRLSILRDAKVVCPLAFSNDKLVFPDPDSKSSLVHIPDV